VRSLLAVLVSVACAMPVQLNAAAPQQDTALAPTFRSRADSIEWSRARLDADVAREYRIVISLFDRRLSVMQGEDTLRTAPAGVASGLTLDYAGHSWKFRTPRGRHTVLRKLIGPAWTPPDWAYAEVAQENHLQLAQLTVGRDVPLRDGSKLTVQNGRVGVVRQFSSKFLPLPFDEHIVFDSTLFIPPFGTFNRRVSGELGRYALDLGDGYMIHGTPDAESIGRAITHGCVRLSDADVAWLYENVPIGTPVYIY
jgi:lipoprotein-anchoring transpeptidase ErfK/SrfK